MKKKNFGNLKKEIKKIKIPTKYESRNVSKIGSPSHKSQFLSNQNPTTTSTLENIESSEVPFSDPEDSGDERPIHKITERNLKSQFGKLKLMPAAFYLGNNINSTDSVKSSQKVPKECLSARGNFSSYQSSPKKYSLKISTDINNLQIEQEGNMLTPNFTQNRLYETFRTPRKISENSNDSKFQQQIIKLEKYKEIKPQKYEIDELNLLPKYEDFERKFEYENLKNHMENLFDKIQGKNKEININTESIGKEHVLYEINENSLLNNLLGIIDKNGNFQIPLHENYAENITVLLRMGFIKRIVYEKMMQSYNEAMVKTIEIMREFENKKIYKNEWKKQRLKICAFNVPSIVFDL